MTDTRCCEVCGAPERMLPTKRGGVRTSILRHHWSYDPEHAADTIDLCDACHRKVHKGKIPEPRTGRVYAGERVRPPEVQRMKSVTTLSIPTDLRRRIEEIADWRRITYTQAVMWCIEHGIDGLETYRKEAA